jgi:hypothetical protein
MNEIHKSVGIPNTLPPLGYGDLRGCCWFGGIGLLLVLLGLSHNAVPLRFTLACWLILPFLGFLRRRTRQVRSSKKPVSMQVRIYTLVVVGFGIGFTFWARQLGLAWPVVVGSLFLIEGLAGVIASLTEWWRLSLLGHSLGLMICGAGIPFVDHASAGLIVGAGVLAGSVSSAGILYWQVRRHEATPTPPVDSKANRVTPDGE